MYSSIAIRRQHLSPFSVGPHTFIYLSYDPYMRAGVVCILTNLLAPVRTPSFPFSYLYLPSLRPSAVTYLSS